MVGIKIDFPDLARIEAEMRAQTAKDMTQAMRTATEHLKSVLRSQVEEAGMGRRLANTWRGQVYPKGRNAIDPAGFAWTKAPKIIDAFARGATIRPVNGAKFLWLPTRNVPRAGRNRKMTPDQVDSLYNAEFVIRPSRRRGVYLAFIPVVAANSGRGFREATARRNKGRSNLKARKTQLVHMFTLVPETKMPLRFDLNAAAEAGAARFVAEMER